MAGQAQVLLNLIKLGRHDDRQRIFLAIDRALLQRREDFGEGHGCGHNAKALVGCHVHRIFHGTHLQTLEVIRGVDGALAVGHVAKAVLGPGKRLEALGVKLAQHFLPDRAVQHGASMRLVAEQEGDVKNLGVGHKIGHRAGRGESQLLRAELNRFNGLALATE